MKDFFIFYEHLKFLFENELYEDSKLLADLLIGIIESKGSLCDPKDKYMVYYYYANSAFELKDYKLAESLFNKALQMNKSNLRPKPKAVSSLDCETDLKIKYNLYTCLMNDKKYQDAYNILDSVPAKQKTPKILFAMSKLCLKLMPIEETVCMFKEYLKNSKFSLVAIDALLSLGVQFDQLPKLPLAMNVEWLNLYLKGKGHSYFKEYKDAVNVFNALDSKFLHKSSEVLSALGTSQYHLGDYNNSCNTFDKLHRQEPAFTTKMDLYAFLLYSDKSDRDKLNALEKLANDMYLTSTSIPETWTIIGYYCLKKKTLTNKSQNIGDNVKCFIDNALSLDSQNQSALLLKAIAYSKYKPMDAAIAYKEAIRVNQTCFEAYKGLVDSLLGLNHVKDAVTVAGNAVKNIGINARTYALYGDALSRDASTQEKSKTYLHKAIKLDPDNQEAVISLVKVSMALLQYQDALDVLGKFIRHNSSNYRLLHLYIELMKKFKRTDEVIEYLNKMSGMDPNNVEIKKMLEKAEQSMDTNPDDSIQSIQVI